ncbi:MAG: serine acetyltransferase [Desulfobacteraceae bacterium]|nr:serine acetyltransferase [Desulfobacteraceae bacterium]
MITSKSTCKTEAASQSSYREKLPGIVDEIIHSCTNDACHTHIDFHPIFSKEKLIQIIYKLREVIFPGYFDSSKIDPVNLSYALGQDVSVLFDQLSEQVTYSIRHDCFRYDMSCQDCEKLGYEKTLSFLSAIPEIQRLLALDVQACLEGDPAAKSPDEIIFCYPGIFAIMVYRMAHQLNDLGVPFIPRIMTEYAHGQTGIDIHPGAEIGEGFVIDHGTGVVIGETTFIGNQVRIYQGVTLGALSLPRNAGEELRGKKRHPTIEDEVIIYSGATILGGHTRIGARSVIGGNVWITESVPPDTTVLLAKPQLIYK